MKISYLGLELGDIHPNSKNIGQMNCTVQLQPDVIKTIRALAEKKLKEKFPDINIAANCSIHISRRLNEDYLTATCRMCVGNGDYLSREVTIPFPNISFEINQPGVEK